MSNEEREALIEEAAKALAGLTDSEWEIAKTLGSKHLAGYFDGARRTLDVFEKAHTSNAEGTREEEWALLAQDFAPEVRRAAGVAFRLGWDYSILRRPVHTPTDDERAKAANDAYHAMVDEAEADGGTWWGFSHQRDAWEDGYQQGLTAGVVRRTVQGEPTEWKTHEH